MFRGLLHYPLAAEQTAMRRPAEAKRTGDPRSQALLDAMEDERQLIGPLQAMIDDAFTMNTNPVQLRQPLTRLRAGLTSHLAHEEAGTLPAHRADHMPERARRNRQSHQRRTPVRARSADGPVGPRLR